MAGLKNIPSFVRIASPLGAALLALGACISFHGQRYQDFTVLVPLPPKQVLILGFMGGREPWDNENRGVRKLALKLRSKRLLASIETVENTKRKLALQLVSNAFDRNHDGQLDQRERGDVRLILYGQSFGAAAVVKLARQLHRKQIPVDLTVQVDSVGRGDAVIPPNVRRAANLFQRNGLFIRGEPEIRAQDPARTEILGNFEYDYRNKNISLGKVGWFKRLFLTAHTKMDHDPGVWSRVEQLIMEALVSGPLP